MCSLWALHNASALPTYFALSVSEIQSIWAHAGILQPFSFQVLPNCMILKSPINTCLVSLLPNPLQKEGSGFILDSHFICSKKKKNQALAASPLAGSDPTRLWQRGLERQGGLQDLFGHGERQNRTCPSTGGAEEAAGACPEGRGGKRASVALSCTKASAKRTLVPSKEDLRQEWRTENRNSIYAMGLEKLQHFQSCGRDSVV